MGITLSDLLEHSERQVVAWRRVCYRFRSEVFKDFYEKWDAKDRDGLIHHVLHEEPEVSLSYIDLVHERAADVYERMSVVDLRNAARRRKVLNYSNMTKPLLIYTLRKLDEEASAIKVSEHDTNDSGVTAQDV